MIRETKNSHTEGSACRLFGYTLEFTGYANGSDMKGLGKMTKRMMSENKFSISEIFQSIIGESSLSGYPALFIRFAGCNLRCSWCDTKYAYKPSYFQSYQELINRIKDSKHRFIVLTGGEPLLQPLLKELIDDVVNNLGKQVVLETNGSLSIEGINKKVHISMDCKTPSSLEHKSCDFSNFQYIKKTDDIKFVIADRLDYEFSKKLIDNHDLFEKANILLQPVHNVLDPKELVDWILEDGLPAKLSIQLHKYIGIK